MQVNFITKYKPYILNEFLSDPQIIETVNMLKSIDQMNILFVGNPLSGKTTLLYAIIRDYFGLKHTESMSDSKMSESNILFINTLKEQGINYFRTEMKTFCQTRCSIAGKKKLVIVDDIDTINEQSQQVFRNYLDKYQKNVCFLTTCTCIQKVIESLQSRLHMVTIKDPSEEYCAEFFDKVCAEENIKVSKEAREYVLSSGNLRKIMNMLEKISLSKTEKLTEEVEEMSLEVCKSICSTISDAIMVNYIEQIKGRRLGEAIKTMYELHNQGYSVIDILDYLFSFVKMTKMLSEDEKYKVIPLLCESITNFHSVHEDVIELAFFTNAMMKTVSS